ncbi:MAG: hypothetical protein RLN75_03375, partial [Longimicrobiales bacterium]
VEVLLDGEGDDARDRALERGDSAAVERFWRLSDPLFLVPGSDRRTEHFARRTWSITREGARNPYAMSWGWDLDELLIRYGWEVGWERRDPGVGAIGASTSAVGHQDPRGQGFVAPAAVWAASPASDRDDWNPGSRRRPRTGYAPAYAPTFLDLDAPERCCPGAIRRSWWRGCRAFPTTRRSTPGTGTPRLPIRPRCPPTGSATACSPPRWAPTERSAAWRQRGTTAPCG